MIWCVICCSLNSAENVQMVTALILQLIQSVIQLPDDDYDLTAADAESQKVRLFESHHYIRMNECLFVLQSKSWIVTIHEYLNSLQYTTQCHWLPAFYA